MLYSKILVQYIITIIADIILFPMAFIGKNDFKENKNTLNRVKLVILSLFLWFILIRINGNLILDLPNVLFKNYSETQCTVQSNVQDSKDENEYKLKCTNNGKEYKITHYKNGNVKKDDVVKIRYFKHIKYGYIVEKIED